MNFYFSMNFKNRNSSMTRNGINCRMHHIFLSCNSHLFKCEMCPFTATTNRWTKSMLSPSNIFHSELAARAALSLFFHLRQSALWKVLSICKSISNETGWGAHWQEIDRFEGSVKYADGTGSCACGQPVNECSSASLCPQPNGITAQQTVPYEHNISLSTSYLEMHFSVFTTLYCRHLCKNFSFLFL